MKKLLRIILVIMLAVVFVIVPFTACDNSAGTVEIVIWEDELNIDHVQERLNLFVLDFQDMYPRAPVPTFRFIPQSEQDAIENLARLAPLGQGPDVLAFLHNQVGEASGSRLLAPALFVEQAIATNSTDSIEAFTLRRAEQGAVDTLFGYPTSAETSVLLYDADRLPSAQAGSFESIAAAERRVSWQLHDNAYYNFGILSDAILFGPEGDTAADINFATTESVANLRNIYGQTATSQTIRNAIRSEDPDTALSSYMQGHTAGIITVPYLWNTFRDEVTRRGGTPRMRTLPTLEGRMLRPFAGYKGYGVSTHSRNPHLAQVVAWYLSTGESQAARMAELKTLPTAVDNEYIDILMADPAFWMVDVYKQALESSLTMPNIVAMSHFWMPGQNALTALYNQSRVAGGAGATDTAINNALRDWRRVILDRSGLSAVE